MLYFIYNYQCSQNNEAFAEIRTPQKNNSWNYCSVWSKEPFLASLIISLNKIIRNSYVLRNINKKNSYGNSCELGKILYQVGVWANDSSKCKTTTSTSR